MEIQSLAEKLWSFSLAFYAMKRNQQAFLHLQDSAGWNVNVLLAVFFMAKYEIILEHKDLTWLCEEIAPLDDRTQALRKKRRLLKINYERAGQSNSKLIEQAGQSNFKLDDESYTEFQQQYEAILQQELSLEKEQQFVLAKCLTQIKSASLKTQSGASESLARDLISLITDISRKNLDCPENNVECQIKNQGQEDMSNESAVLRLVLNFSDLLKHASE